MTSRHSSVNIGKKGFLLRAIIKQMRAHCERTPAFFNLYRPQCAAVPERPRTQAYQPSGKRYRFQPLASGKRHSRHRQLRSIPADKLDCPLVRTFVERIAADPRYRLRNSQLDYIVHFPSRMRRPPESAFISVFLYHAAASIRAHCRKPARTQIPIPDRELFRICLEQKKNGARRRRSASCFINPQGRSFGRFTR